ncbi:ribosomal protein S6--L-glutamate ligase [Litorivivens lipolytica]|uniref:Ribosomal protein S6--L-glutamate ligase n=1 Tax=Litorivivens lipolytica TaxID=1524264 RepID=A0A7W4Z4X0_9GAMM|nr:hypothetical protein [Litorivivens lipolytica]MBB3046924.1 ribosomal protein S6--L-glutamate ligase [Litorivivens lipolytica]
MAWISFDVFRTLGFPDTVTLKAEQLFRHKQDISAAEWVLFPPYWQLNSLLYGLNAKTFPSEASYRLGHNKVEMTRAFEVVAPANTPLTLIAANTDDEAERLWSTMTLPFVAKQPKASMGEGVWLIESAADWRTYREKTDTLYVQEYLPIDRDIRVVIVGDTVLAAYWRKQAPRGFYNNVAKGGEVDYSPVPAQAVELALHLARSLNINHAGFDIAMVGNHPYVLEFNRLFGNQGIPGGDARLREAILDLLQRESRPQPTAPAKPRRLRRAA